MLYVYTDLETSLKRNQERFEKSDGEDRSLLPGAVLSTWKGVTQNFNDYQDLFVGISYDINFSKLVPASHLRGGIEFAVRYIIRKFKPKRIIHRVCPDYI